MKSFSELTRKEKVIELLRWLSVLPVAWLVGLVGYVLTYSLVVYPLMSALSYEGSDRWLRHLIGGFLGGAAFVIAGAKTAPRFHFATAIVLAAGTIVFDVRIHREDYLPVVAAAAAAASGAAVSFYWMKAKGRPGELGMAILVIPVLLCSLELGLARPVFGTTWPGWVYFAIAGISGGLGGGIMATHRLRGTVSGLVAGLGALAALGFVLEWRPGIPRLGFMVVGVVGALPGLGLYYVFTRSSRSSKVNKVNIERFEAMVPAQTRLIRGFAPDATCGIEKGLHGYFCVSWLLGDRGARQLFVEQAGRQVAPFDLRVGIYFADSVRATIDPRALSVALDALLKARATLQPLGVLPTFTQGCATRDNTRFGWTDEELREWLTKVSDHRDLVWLSDLQNGEPSDQQIEAALTALAPVWLAWNSLG